MKLMSFFFILLLLLVSCIYRHKKEDHHIIQVHRALSSPFLDGKSTENAWNMAEWYALDQNWAGESYDHTDFNGRYKLTWDPNALYVLVEITDDVYYDQTSDPLKLWWNDDCLEVFVDEDNSGGLHQFDHNAFAYHIALDGNVVDFGLDKQPHLFNSNVTCKRFGNGIRSTWEIAIQLFDSGYNEAGINKATTLAQGKKIGFALAYCDNDGSIERENFIGSVFVPREDKNQGWINADIFGTLELTE